MPRDPDYTRTVSLKLSEVLSDIGVNEKIVLTRRRMILLNETILSTTTRLLNYPISFHHFGSQTEGSTTVGLNSDIDTLFCHTGFNVLQDWSEWQPGMLNLLMIQDERTSPGYCLLQLLHLDEPLPVSLHVLEPGIYHTVRGGRVLQKNTVNTSAIERDVINGPAKSSKGKPGVADQDYVFAHHCKSWPNEAQAWLVRRGIGGWPTEVMKRYCETTGCFVVPVSSKSGQYEDLEWRISTSQAERYMMFSLNITQIRCYILMKMILKTFISPQCDGVISSFMCKTVLFHCIQNKISDEWQEHNMLTCLNCCLLALQNCVRQANCPHFIIHGNNLMAGKILSSNKHKLLEILQVIISSEGRSLFEIPIDGLGFRFSWKMNRLPCLQVEAKLNSHIPRTLVINSGCNIGLSHILLLSANNHVENKMVQQNLSDFIFKLVRINRETDLKSSENSVCRLLTAPLCSSLGSVIASHDINTNNTLSPDALSWFAAGLISDVSSGRLKFASALYCVGDINTTEFVLRKTEDLYDLVEPVCGCCLFQRSPIKPGFCDKSDTVNEELITRVTAACVKFLRCEIHCVPKELQYEMFRCTQEDTPMGKECWMDLAVVDSLPYLYFLQYKTYGHLHRAAGQQCALTYLVTATETEPNLSHRETALNLLGQCMEQEKRHMDALHCYVKSLNVRARNNAAKIHICRLLNELVNKQIG